MYDISTNTTSHIIQESAYMVALDVCEFGVAHNGKGTVAVRSSASNYQNLVYLDTPPVANDLVSWVTCIKIDSENRRIVGSLTDGVINIWDHFATSNTKKTKTDQLLTPRNSSRSSFKI
jgi:hypothetical protein